MTADYFGFLAGEEQEIRRRKEVCEVQKGGRSRCVPHLNLWSPQFTHHLFVGKWTLGLGSGLSPSPIIKDFNVLKSEFTPVL